MKKRIVPILTFTVALVLVTGLAYAAKKKDQSKSADRSPDPTHEEEALQAELLEATGERVAKTTASGESGSKRINTAVSGEKSRGPIITMQQKR